MLHVRTRGVPQGRGGGTPEQDHLVTVLELISLTKEFVLVLFGHAFHITGRC